jgi:hypothetical protein
MLKQLRKRVGANREVDQGEHKTRQSGVGHNATRRGELNEYRRDVDKFEKLLIILMRRMKNNVFTLKPVL